MTKNIQHLLFQVHLMLGNKNITSLSRNLSQTEVFMSNEAKLSWVYQTDVWDKFHTPWLAVRKVF